MRTEQSKEYFDTFTPHGDAVRVRFTRSGSVSESFVVQYEIFLDDRWLPVVRYDSAHGLPHRDELDCDGHVVDKHWFPASISNAEAFTVARQEFERQWRIFREEFMRRRP